jgi:hypothetical protein
MGHKQEHLRTIPQGIAELRFNISKEGYPRIAVNCLENQEKKFNHGDTETQSWERGAGGSLNARRIR